VKRLKRVRRVLSCGKVKTKEQKEKRMNKVKVYGADWCKDTKRTLRHLDRLGVDYDYINIEQNAEAARWVREQNAGRERKPTVEINGRVLSVPSDEELEEQVRGQNAEN
jgi:mycoredoxin